MPNFAVLNQALMDVPEDAMVSNPTAATRYLSVSVWVVSWSRQG